MNNNTGQQKKRPPNFFRLYFQDQNGEQAHTVQIIGMKEDESILISAPSENDTLIPIQGEVVLKTFHSRSAFTIKTHVLETTESPYPIVHLEWPTAENVKKSVMRQARRAHTGLPCSLTGTLISADGKKKKEKIQALIINVSMTGIAVFVDKEKGTLCEPQFDVFFELPVESEMYPVSVKGIVVRNEIVADGHVIGATFDAKFGRMDKLAMAAYIHGLIADSLEEPPFPVIEQRNNDQSIASGNSLDGLAKLLDVE